MESERENRWSGSFCWPAAMAVIIAFFALFPGKPKQTSKRAEVITVSTLEKIIEVSELSTFTAVYNGIAQVAGGGRIPRKSITASPIGGPVKPPALTLEKIKITADNDTPDHPN